MNKGTVAGCTMLVLLSLSVAPVLASPTIDVGTYYWLPTDTVHPLAIPATGNDDVGGLNFYIQVGDGGIQNGGSDTSPIITGVDITGPGTLLNGVSLSLGDPQIANRGNLMWLATAQTQSGTVHLSNQNVAIVTVDSTGAAIGVPKSLSLSNVAQSVSPPDGYTTDFSSVASQNTSVPSQNNNGQIVVVPQTSMFWTGSASPGYWTDSTWTNNPPNFPSQLSTAVVPSNTVPVQVNDAQGFDSLYVGGGGEVNVGAAGSLHIGTKANLNLNGTLAVAAGGALTGEPGSSLEMSGGTLSGSVNVTLPVSAIAGTSNLTTPLSGDTITISGPLGLRNRGTTLNKNGPGTLNIAATSVQSHDPGTVFNANAGRTNIASSVGPNLSVNATGGTVDFTTVDQTSTHVGISNGGTVQAHANLGQQQLAVGTGGGTLFVDTGKSVAGGLTIADGATLIRNGSGSFTITDAQSFRAGSVIQFGSGGGGGGAIPQAQGPQGVPEPSTLALLVGGALALLLWRRR